MSLIKKAHMWTHFDFEDEYANSMKSSEKKQTFSLSDSELKFLKKIGQRVHKRLHDLNKPVEWLAWESDTSRATIRRIFDADRNIGILTLDRVARALGYKDGVPGLFNDL